MKFVKGWNVRFAGCLDHDLAPGFLDPDLSRQRCVLSR